MVRIFWLSLLLPLPSCGEVREETATAQARMFLSCLDVGVGPDFLGEKITVAFEGMQLPQVIEHLNAKSRLPISFIEGPAPVQVEMRVKEESVRALLGKLLGQAQDYRCSVIENHVVIHYDEPALSRFVEGVKITEQLRGQAARSYVEHLSGQIESFEGLSVFVGGGLESSIFSVPVTLTRDATVLEHLCQLLGRDADVIFWIRYASTGSRYLTFGSAP